MQDFKDKIRTLHIEAQRFLDAYVIIGAALFFILNIYLFITSDRTSGAHVLVMNLALFASSLTFKLWYYFFSMMCYCYLDRDRKKMVKIYGVISATLSFTAMVLYTIGVITTLLFSAIVF